MGRMKFVIIYLMILLLEFSVTTSEKSEFLPENEMKWDIDFDNMLDFEKSFMKHDMESPTPKKGQIFHETQIDSVDNAINVSQRKISNLKECDALHEDVKNYIKRYINLFLVTCGLENMPESDENIKVNLEFSITKSDLSFLHDLSKDLSLKKVQDNLHRLDTIFEEGLLRKQESSFMTSFIQYLASFVSSIRIPSSWYYSKTFYYIILLILTLLMALLTNIAKVITIMLTFNNFVLIEGILDYVNKLKQAETEDFVRKLQARSIADACDPNKKSWWTYVSEFFTSDECLNYHMTFVKSKTDEVSLIKCILDAYNHIVLQYPFKVLGASINIFSENVNESMPFKWLWIFITNLVVLILVFVFFICLIKPRLRLSYFGAALDMDFSNSRTLPPPTEHIGRIEDRRMQEIHGSETDAIMRENTGNEKEPSQLKAVNSTSEDSSKKSNEKCDSELEENTGNGKVENVSENGK